MRFWNFQLEGAPNGGWSSHFNGQFDPGAPLVEIDITTAAQDQTGTAGSITIWGQPVSLLKASQGFYNKKYSLSLGMAAGLPLATAQASQAGQVLGGTDVITSVFSSFEGLTQFLGFGLGGFPKSQQTPAPFQSSNQYPMRNIVLDWRKGTQLGPALMQTFKTAYPELTPSVSVSPTLVAKQDNIHFAGTIADFNQSLREFVTGEYVNSQPQQYQGVNIVMGNGKIDAHDQTQPSGSKQIAFTDLIGQPTFIARNEISLKVVMRGDLNVGEQITLPQGLVLNVSGNLGLGADLAVSGSWTINTLRWIGNSRSPSGDAWCTVITGNQAPGAANPSSPTAPASPAETGGGGRGGNAPVLT
jgi:hypothetical protein